MRALKLRQFQYFWEYGTMVYIAQLFVILSLSVFLFQWMSANSTKFTKTTAGLSGFTTSQPLPHHKRFIFSYSSQRTNCSWNHAVFQSLTLKYEDVLPTPNTSPHLQANRIQIARHQSADVDQSDVDPVSRFITGGNEQYTKPPLLNCHFKHVIKQ